MKEPRLYDDNDQNPLPFSELPRSDLELIARGEIVLRAGSGNGDDDRDVDFARRYAAALLRERA